MVALFEVFSSPWKPVVQVSLLSQPLNLLQHCKGSSPLLTKHCLKHSPAFEIRNVGYGRRGGRTREGQSELAGKASGKEEGSRGCNRE